MFRSGPLALLLTVLLAACGGGAGGGSTTETPVSSSGNTAPGVIASFTLQDVEVTPYAVWADELSKRTITVKARSTTTGNVALQLSYFDGLVGGSGAQIVKAMYDDGTNGDQIARDGVWTLTFSLGLDEPDHLRLYDNQADAVSISIAATDGTKALSPSNSIDARVDVALLSRTVDGAFPVHSLDAATQATDTMLNIVDPSFDEADMQATLQHAYSALGADAFDFAVLFHTRTTGDGVPRSVGVKNDVAGINVPTFDNSADYGSAGRLQQLVFQNSHMLGLEINHEMGHRWGAYLNRPALNLSLPTGFHWGASNHVGQMGNGPYLLAEAGGYRVTNADDSENFIANPFSNLELYLMGLAQPDEVQPLRFVTDASVNVQFDSLVPESSTRQVTIDDIVSVYGARAPAAAASQNAFAALYVVVSDRLLSAPEYTFTSLIAQYAAGTSNGGKRTGGLFEALDPPSFSAATGFRATLDTTLPLAGG